MLHLKDLYLKSWQYETLFLPVCYKISRWISQIIYYYCIYYLLLKIQDIGLELCFKDKNTILKNINSDHQHVDQAILKIYFINKEKYIRALFTNKSVLEKNYSRQKILSIRNSVYNTFLKFIIDSAACTLF